MEEESSQKGKAESVVNRQGEPRKEENLAPSSSDGRRGTPKGLVWTIRVLIVLMALLVASGIANLVVSQRAFDNSRKQAEAIKQLTQSIKDIQRSIIHLSKLIEQAQQEEEEPDEDWSGSPAGDGSI